MSELDVEAQKANVEANKAAEAETPKGPLDAEDVQIAAGHYASMCKMIKGYSRAMGGKGLARVMVALAEFPYADTYPKFRSDAEQKLFTFMLSVQSAKAKIGEALKADMQSIETDVVDGIVEETLAKARGETDGNKVD